MSATGYRSIAYFLPVALHARLKAAWWSTRDEPEGAPSLAGLVEVAIGREADRLEQLYNSGDPFPASPARAQGVNPRGTTGYRHQTYYLPVALHARLKAAWWSTRDEPEGAPSLAGLVEVAIGREADRLEQLYNSGDPFPASPARAQGVNPRGATGYRHQTYYLPVALHARLKAAWWSTRDEPEGAPSLAGLVEVAFEREADRLEQLYNSGDPFPPAPAKARGISRTAAQRQGEWLRGEWERRRQAQTPPADADD